MCTVLLPPGGYTTAVNKYIISYHIPYHISYHILYHISYHISYYISHHIIYRIVSYIIISHHNISYRIIYHITSYRIIYHIISYHISHRITSHRIIYLIIYHITSHHIIYRIIYHISHHNNHIVLYIISYISVDTILFSANSSPFCPIISIMYITVQSNPNFAGPRGRAVWRVGLWPFACWDCGFESHLMHGWISVMSAVCCQVEVCATSWSLAQRSPTDFCVPLCVI